MRGSWGGSTGSSSSPVSVPQRNATAARRRIRTTPTTYTATLSAAGAATGITGSALRVPLRVNPANNTGTEPIDLVNDPNFSYTGAPGLLWGFGNVKPPQLTGTTSQIVWSWSILSEVYADQFEIVLTAQSSTMIYRIRIDEQWMTIPAVTASVTSGSVYRILVNFGSVGVHKVQFETTAAVSGFQMLPKYATHRVDLTNEVPVTFVGDSITAGANIGSGGYSRIESWAYYFAETMGWVDVRNPSIGGTGFTVAGTETVWTSRLADINVVGGRYVSYLGLNDVANVATTLPGAIDTVFTKIKSMNPVEFIVFGCHPMQASTMSNSAYIQVNNLLKSKAAQYGATFVDPFVVKWVTGTGTVGNLKNDGNADSFVAADGIHPTNAGAIYLGTLYADKLIAS